MQSSEFTYKTIRSVRKSVSVQITKDGQVIVRCPTGMSDAAVHQIIQGKTQWIEKHLDNLNSTPALPCFTEQELHDLSAHAAQIIPQRVAYYAREMGVTYGRISIRKQHTRWGSCSSKGNLNFNCLLVLTPPEVLDYVVIHELCHRKEMNHSDRFWNAVAKIMPDYKIQQRWLKENGAALIRRLP